MNKIFLTCIHDRHTDDKFKAFASEIAAKAYLYGIQKPTDGMMQKSTINMGIGAFISVTTIISL